MSRGRIARSIEESITRFTNNNINVDPRFILLDDETYFELKIEILGNADLAILNELEELFGLRIFHNSIGFNFIDIA